MNTAGTVLVLEEGRGQKNDSEALDLSHWDDVEPGAWGVKGKVSGGW